MDGTPASSSTLARPAAPVAVRHLPGPRAARVRARHPHPPVTADPLRRLWDAARALPGDKAPVPARPPPSVPPLDTERPPPSALPAMRREVALWLAEVARAVEPALAQALGPGSRRWDQVDALHLLTADLHARMASQRARWQSLVTHADGAVVASAVEAVLMLDAVTALVLLLEQRLAVLVRLRLRSPTPSLLADHRPFLDVAAALEAASRAWA